MALSKNAPDGPIFCKELHLILSSAFRLQPVKDQFVSGYRADILGLHRLSNTKKKSIKYVSCIYHNTEEKLSCRQQEIQSGFCPRMPAHE